MEPIFVLEYIICSKEMESSNWNLQVVGWNQFLYFSTLSGVFGVNLLKGEGCNQLGIPKHLKNNNLINNLDMFNQYYQDC